MSYFGVVARASLLAALAVLPLFGGCEQEQGFECGRAVPGTNTIRTCDRANEVCVCATNSCAKKVGLTPAERAAVGAELGAAGAPDVPAGQWGDCAGPGETGYRYAETPFAGEHQAGLCVPAIDLVLGDLVPSKDAPGPGCPGQVHIPDASSAGGSGGDASGGTGGSTGGSGGDASGGTGGDDGGASGGTGGAAGAPDDGGVP